MTLEEGLVVWFVGVMVLEIAALTVEVWLDNLDNATWIGWILLLWPFLAPCLVVFGWLSVVMRLGKRKAWPWDD